VFAADHVGALTTARLRCCHEVDRGCYLYDTQCGMNNSMSVRGAERAVRLRAEERQKSDAWLLARMNMVQVDSPDDPLGSVHAFVQGGFGDRGKLAGGYTQVKLIADDGRRKRLRSPSRTVTRHELTRRCHRAVTYTRSIRARVNRSTSEISIASRPSSAINLTACMPPASFPRSPDTRPARTHERTRADRRANRPAPCSSERAARRPTSCLSSARRRTARPRPAPPSSLFIPLLV